MALEIIGLVIATIAAAIAWWQIIISAKSTVAENTRLKNESTLNFYNQLREQIRVTHNEIRKKYSVGLGDIISEEDAKTIYGSFDDKVKLQNILSSLERLSIGEKYGVYSYDVLYELSRTQLMSMYGVYYHYISYVRERSPLAYCVFEELIFRFNVQSKRERKPIAHAFRRAQEHMHSEIK